MQVQVADAGQLRKRITVSYTAAEVADRESRVLGQLAERVNLPGFRPGKTPKAVLRKRFSAEARQQTISDLADEGINRAIKDHNLRPFGPIMQDKDGGAADSQADGLRFAVAFDIKPDIAVPEPSAFSIADAPVQLDPAEVEKSIENLARRAGSEQPLSADETVQEDDGITITGKILRDGASVKDLHDFHHLVGGYALLGKPPAEVVAILKDKKVGDAVRIETVLPKSFAPAAHAEQPAVLEFTIASGRRLRPAPIDDALGAKFGFGDLAGLRAFLTTTLTRGKEDEKRRAQLDQLAEQLLAKVAVTVPAKALEESIAQATANAAKQAEGKPAEEAAKAAAELPAKVERDLKRFLILDALIADLKIQVSQQDVSDQIMMAAQQTGRRPEDILKSLKDSNQTNQVVMEIAQAKALETFLDKVLGRPVAANPAHGEAGHVHGPDCNH